MWQELSLVHRRTESAREPFPTGAGLLWKTCLRELFFLNPGERIAGPSEPGRGARTLAAGPSEPGRGARTLAAGPGEPGRGARTLAAGPGELYRGYDAHRFLVEICSGLHSPLFGETEVFGQFRAFRAAHSWEPPWEELLDAVEEDVRKLRRTHLVDIGSQSYGSLARRHLPEGEPVVVVGGGHLAQELLPWLEGHEVTIAVRDPSRVSFAPAVTFADVAVKDAHWLIAAPLSNEQLAGIWKRNPARTVLDFRGESAFDTAPAPRYFALRALYAELESVKELHARKKREALAYAEELSSRRQRAVLHRPYGWEDAFA